MRNSPFPAFCSPSFVFLSYVEHTTSAPLMILLPFKPFQMLLAATAQPQPFANTLALTPFPSGLEPTV
jgi:hypothetical protein